MEPLSGVGPLRPGWARVWVSLRREAPLSGCYLGCCVLAAARVLLRWSVCTRVALAEKAQAACAYFEGRRPEETWRSPIWSDCWSRPAAA